MRADRILGFGALLLALPVGLTSWGYGVGSPKSPGAGFWPFLIAASMAGLGAALALRPDRALHPRADGGSRWRSLGIALATLGIYVLVLEPLGYLLATFLLLVVQLKWVEARSWRTTVLTAGIAAAVSFAIFRVFLKVSLPVGILPLPRSW